jgi:predicted RNase H-like HicB family nuclease
MPRSLEEYLKLPYHIVLVSDEDEEGNAGWVAEVSELPGCMSQGATPDEAIDHIRDAMEGWISVALEDGRDIPEPVEPTRFSGRFVVRLPRTLHAEVSRLAEEEGVSLNQFVSVALAGAVGWRSRQREQDRVLM